MFCPNPRDREGPCRHKEAVLLRNVTLQDASEKPLLRCSQAWKMSCVVRRFRGTCADGGWIAPIGLGVGWYPGIPYKVREGVPASNSGTERKSVQGMQNTSLKLGLLSYY